MTMYLPLRPPKTKKTPSGLVVSLLSLLVTNVSEFTYVTYLFAVCLLSFSTFNESQLIPSIVAKLPITYFADQGIFRKAYNGASKISKKLAKHSMEVCHR